MMSTAIDQDGTSSEDASRRCPAWCENKGRCRGQHSTEFLSVPATGDAPQTTDLNGAVFPAVTTRGTWNPQSYEEPLSVSLHLGSPRDDMEVFMRPEEARKLVAHLQAVLKQIDPGYEL